MLWADRWFTRNNHFLCQPEIFMVYHLMETNTRVQLLKPFKNFMHSDLSDYRLKGLRLIYLRITRIDRRPWITALSIYVRLAVKRKYTYCYSTNSVQNATQSFGFIA
jgi:hypothetical protein